jgi:hypothetical protein
MVDKIYMFVFSLHLTLTVFVLINIARFKIKIFADTRIGLHVS